MNFTEITFELLILGAAAFFLLIQIFYFVFFFFRIAFHKEQKIDSQSLPPISILVAARSEAHNLVEFLPYLFEQNYPEFEVVVVNDRSWDDTKDVLKAFQLKYSNLHVVNIEETNHKSNGKKMAVTLGIKGAKYEHLVLTDADCKPVSRNWLMSIGMKFQNPDTKIVQKGKRIFKFINSFRWFLGRASISFICEGRKTVYGCWKKFSLYQK
jgi:cellulose synthase/poly-beta-1,6-N-acetylglucosamine synthase-like glycosyltransferase